MARTLTEEDLNMIADYVMGRLRGVDLPQRSLGMGDPEKSGPAGKLNADYAQVDLTGLDLANIDVPHDIGAVPTTCTLTEWENAADPTTVLSMAAPVDKHLWTVSNCRVRLAVQVGTQAGTIARFLVGGR